ncbi:MAG: right-handed parallel beta-helix repeat-containing protein [Ignavibacteriales bacterium]|nr:right-handed parallel beta-helix repeat-containing protein [Ignavibacteriales bacterium]
MKKIVQLLLATVFVLHAKIITVPADHAKIQLAINASAHGDTVVVYPGTYYENINFKGKNIVVTSRFYENNDRQFILSTIINGSQPAHPDTASCVLIVSGENSSAILQGFTLTEGKGTRWTDEHGAGIYREGGGVLVTLSSPVIRYNYIVKNEILNGNNVTSMGGGGIRIGDGGGVVENNIITLNKAHYGGGIVLNYCSGTIVRNNMILENSVRQLPGFGGGGLWLGSPKPGDSSPNIIENNTIYGNVALDDPNLSFAGGRGGALVMHSSIKATIRNNIIWENHSAFPISAVADLGAIATVEYNDILGGYPGTGNIDVDPQFSDSSFILKSTSPCVDAGDSSTQFYDPHFGINPELAVAPAQGTKRNDMGAYGGPGAAHFMSFARSSLFLPLDVIDLGYHLPNDSAGVFGYFYIFNWGSKQLKVDSARFTTTNAFSVDLAQPTTINVNSSALAQLTWRPKVQILYADTMLLYHNSTYISNPARLAVRGNAIPTPLMSVNLTEHNFGTFDINVPQKDTVVYVYNLGTGRDSISVSVNSTGVNPTTAVTASPAGFSLMPGDSQAVTFTFYPKQIIKTFIGLYTPKMLFKSFLGEDTTTKEKSMRFRLTGTLGVEKEGRVAESFSLSQNYPNPFNPVTTISFTIQGSGFTSLKVYDLLGREVAVLVNEELQPGTYRAHFDASQLSSGVYVYTLRVGRFVSSKKLTVTK